MCLLLLLLVMIMMVDMGNSENDRIKLKDIQTLTLHSDRWTAARRTSPIQQLTCVGDHCNRVRIYSAQCYNRGSDGRSIQWECKADMPSKYKFGQLDMSCEGYDSKDDEYIFAGSCGLRYTIVERSGGHQQQAFPGGNYFSGHDRMKPATKSTKNESFSFIPIIVVALIIFFIYYKCLRKSSKSNETDNSNTARHGYGNDGNQFPFFARPSAPPPPGFRSDLFQQESQQHQPPPQPSMASSYPKHSASGRGGSSSIWPGMLGGMATGGLMGYLLGSNQNRTVPDHTSSYFDDDNNFGRSSTADTFMNSSGGGFFGGGGGSNDDGDMAESTGFASTSER